MVLKRTGQSTERVNVWREEGEMGREGLRSEYGTEKTNKGEV